MKINIFSYILVTVSISGLFFPSCQKKFDPGSYAPPMSFNGYTNSNQVAASSQIAYFGFEGDLKDSISGTSGTASGTSFTTGIRGQALQGGIGNYALFTPTAAIKNLQSMTLAYWVTTAQNPNGIMTPVCFANSGQFWGNLDMFFDGQTATSSVFKLHFFTNGGSTEVWNDKWTLQNPWGNWIHIVLSYDATSGNVIFYVNGSSYGTMTVSTPGPLNFANFPAIVFGTEHFQTTPSLTSATGAQGWTSFLTGALDQVRIYNKALAPADIKALYQLENLGK